MIVLAEIVLAIIAVIAPNPPQAEDDPVVVAALEAGRIIAAPHCSEAPGLVYERRFGTAFAGASCEEWTTGITWRDGTVVIEDHAP